jgi:hypothetical protein
MPGAISLKRLSLVDTYPVSQNVKPEPWELDEKVLKLTSLIIVDTLVEWKIKQLRLLYEEDNAKRLANMIARRARLKGINITKIKRI